MNENTTTEETKYIKRIDDLIEEAEIEAELEAENRIRSKNTKILGISLLGAAFSMFVYIQMNDSVEFDVAVQEQAPAITEINNLGLPINNSANEKMLPPSIEMASLSPKKTISEATVAKSPAPIPPAPKIKQVKKKSKPVQMASLAPTIKPQPAAAPRKKVKPQPTRTASLAPVQNSSSDQKYFIQTGIFSSKSNADNFSNKLLKAGFKPSITKKNKDLTRYVVIVGKFGDEKSSASMSSELKASGFSAQIMKNSDASYSFQVASLKTEKEAENLQNQLSLKGFLSTSEKRRSNVPLFAVMLGGYGSTASAKNSQKKLTQAGFKNHFIR